MSGNIVWHSSSVERQDREKLLDQRGVLLWFTGLSGSGKSTVANAVQAKLYENKKLTYLLDGDNIRHGLCNDLGFSLEDRTENIRRIGEVSKLFVDSGIITLGTFNQSWNGTIYGKPLPADDYWYVLKLDASSPEKTGHFSLKR